MTIWFLVTFAVLIASWKVSRDGRKGRYGLNSRRDDCMFLVGGALGVVGGVLAIICVIGAMESVL